MRREDVVRATQSFRCGALQARPTDPIDPVWLIDGLGATLSGWSVTPKPAARMKSARSTARPLEKPCHGACIALRREIWIEESVFDAFHDGDPDAAAIVLHEVGHALCGHAGTRFDFKNRLRDYDAKGEAGVEQQANWAMAELFCPEPMLRAGGDAEEIAARAGAPRWVVAAQRRRLA